MVAEESLDHVAPLDEDDATEVGELGQRQVGHLGGAFQAVQVGVVQGQTSGVGTLGHLEAVDQREGG